MAGTGVPYFPQTLPANSVVGRLAPNSGPTEAIPFAQLSAALGIGGSNYLLASNIAGTNTITGTTATAPALAANQVVFLIPANTNTGAVTFDRDAQGTPKNVFANGAALAGGELQAGMPMVWFYDGTVYNVIEQQAIADGQPLLVNAADVTKKLKFLLSAIATGTTRTITVPDANITLANWSTGDVKLTLKTVADSGWVLMNDTTIGNAASGGTGRANADTVALFTLLWNNTVDADCAVSTGRGANAAADYAANKTIALPKTLGRALASYGAGAGLTSRALAHVVGEENHQLTTAELASHTHVQVIMSGGSGFGGSNQFSTTPTTVSGLVTQSAGSDTPHNTMQPTLFLSVMIKL